MITKKITRKVLVLCNIIFKRNFVARLHTIIFIYRYVMTKFPIHVQNALTKIISKIHSISQYKREINDTDYKTGEDKGRRWLRKACHVVICIYSRRSIIGTSRGIDKKFYKSNTYSKNLKNHLWRLQRVWTHQKTVFYVHYTKLYMFAKSLRLTWYFH